MPALFDFLYREYCRTRLAEMRKQRQLIDSREAPETNCDADHTNGAVDRGGDSDGTRHESDQAGLDQVLPI
jgi:hypothetical protein